MSRSYKTVMVWSAITAIVLASIYCASVVIALGDGIGVGLEIPRGLNSVAAVAVLAPAIIASTAWIVDRSARQSALRDIRPLVRVEIHNALALALDERRVDFARAVSTELAAVLEPGMKRMVEAVGAKSAAHFRQVVTCDLTDVIEQAIGRAHRAGMVNQAQLAGGTVRQFRSATRTSADD